MTPSRKSRRLKLQNGRCHYCEGRIFLFPCEGEKLATWDHLIPKSRDGDNSYGNTVLCCKDCNQAKGNLTEAEFTAAVNIAGGYRNLWGRSMVWREGQGAFISGTFKLGDVLGPLLIGSGLDPLLWSECEP